VADNVAFSVCRSYDPGGGEKVARVGASVSKNDWQNEDLLQLGERSIWNEAVPFGVSQRDRAQHLYCLGKSGTGKTTLLRNLLIQDIQEGRGVALIDVHGDLAEELLEFVPPHRIDHVVYFNPADEAHPISLNPFFDVDPEKRHVVASNIVGAFKGIWRDSWGVRMEYVLYAAVATMLECEGTTLLGVLRMFTDSGFRRSIVKRLNDPMLRGFWTDEFERWDPRLRNEIVAPIQNKVGALLMTPLMRNIFGQVRRKVGFRFMMDESRIFIANLNKGALGEDKANLLGSLIIAELQYAALGRANLAVEDRVPFCLCVDEFQNFQTDSFATILSEARKYGLSLVLSHQFASQLEDEIADAVFGNTGTIIAFRVGYEDAKRLSNEFENTYPPHFFSSLPNYHVCARLMKNGTVHEPFLGRTLPPLGLRHGRHQTIIARSREKYAARREIVEYKHRKWMKF
jgi:hypothetical protein